LETTTFKEEEISTIGEFGLVDLLSSNILTVLVHLTVNLELKLYLFGKLSAKQWAQKTGNTNLQFCYLMRDMEADLEH